MSKDNTIYGAINESVNYFDDAKKLSKLKQHSDSMLIIHYACESFEDNNNDNNKVSSPRITSIEVYNIKNKDTKSFSIHEKAEILKILNKNIDSEYDKLEKSILEDFYNFVKKHKNYYWLHWNMRNNKFGFEAIEHRYKVLKVSDNEIYSIPANKRYNLSDIILDIYGDDCVPKKQRMNRLMELNEGIPQDFLSGENEAKAFQNKEHLQLRDSTICKVGWFRTTFFLLLEGKIKTDKSKWYDNVTIKKVVVSSSSSSSSLHSN